jgi:hypothetical protein
LILAEKKKSKTQLPVDGILVEVCGTSSTVDNYGHIFECETHEHYLMDVFESEVELTESPILTVARKSSPEIDQWLNEHIGDSIGYERNGEYVLKQDGAKKKVTQNEYVKALKETPIINFAVNEDVWHVRAENPYGMTPHIMEFELIGETGEISYLKFQ